MRLALLAVASAVLAVTAACARDTKPTVETPPPAPPPPTVYSVETTGAELRSAEAPSPTAIDATVDDAAIRMAAQICDREVRCHAAGSRTVEECRRASIDRSRTEVEQWRCSPTATRERAAQCLASIDAEPCEVNFDTLSALCSSDLRCETGGGPLLLP